MGFGEENLLIAIYPEGRNDREKALGNLLTSLPYVENVQSLSSLLPEGVPEFMVPKSSLDLVRKDGYSRMVITLNLPGESQESYKAVTTIRQILKVYTGEDSYLVGDTTATMDMENILRTDNAKVNTLSMIVIFLVVMLSFKSVLFAIVAMIPIELAIMSNMSFSFLEGTNMIFIGYVYRVQYSAGRNSGLRHFNLGSLQGRKREKRAERKPLLPPLKRAYPPSLFPERFWRWSAM